MVVLSVFILVCYTERCYAGGKKAVCCSDAGKCLIKYELQVWDSQTTEDATTGDSMNVPLGITITNGREPRTCLGLVFSCKLGSFSDNTKNVAACKWPLLKLKTRPRFCPVS